MYKVATWNVNSLKVRLEHVLQWVSEQQPTLLALQETKMTDALFPAAAFAELNYEVVFSGQKTYNGVAILSQQKMIDVVTDIPELVDAQRRILAVTCGDVRVINVYIPNGQSLSSEKFAYKMHWLEKMLAYVETQLRLYPNLLILGDFNIAPEDIDVHDPQAWEGKVHVSPEERAKFQAFLDLGLVDCLRKLHPDSVHFSWWDYRQAAFRRNLGLRIDHILASSNLAAVCERCYVDKAPRKLERPSDHAVVIADFAHAFMR